MIRIIFNTVMFIFASVFIYIMSCYGVHGIADSLCLDYEEVPFRWQAQGGLFGGTIKVETTEDNSDGIMQGCSNHLESEGFWELGKNIQNIANTNIIK